MQIDWGETKLLSGPLQVFFFFLPELVIQRYGHWRDIIQKKKTKLMKKKKQVESWSNSVHF